MVVPPRASVAVDGCGDLVDQGPAVIDSEERVWWTTAQAVAQLRVKPETLRDWVRRSGVRGFPTVDRPVRAGRHAAYLAEQLLLAEAYTRRSSRGNKRAA